MNLTLTNSGGTGENSYDFHKWTADLSGMRFRTSYLDRFGKPGYEKQGDGNETLRTLTLSYGLSGENDTSFIADTDELYAALRKDLAPFYIEDSDNERRLLVSVDELDLTPKAGTELRFNTARVRFTALDAFWEALTATVVESGSAGMENQDTLSCTNPGVVTVYPVITLEPTESNPNFSLINNTTDDIITIGSNSFVPGTSLEIDCQNGTVYLTNGSTRTEISSAIADGTGFLHLVPGANEILYESAHGAIHCEISYRRRWPF